jgi:uracil phosphoribosyltransferase
MVDPVSSLLPFPVPVNHLGMFRRAGPSSKLEAVEYYNNLSDHQHSSSSAGNDNEGPVDLAIIVDPIIATGVTCLGAVESLREYGAKRIIVLSILCAAPGIAAVAASADNVEIWTGHCDPGTDEKGMIRPGIGDVGDRLFLTLGK